MFPKQARVSQRNCVREQQKVYKVQKKVAAAQRLGVAISSRRCWTQREPAAKRPCMDYDDPLCCLEALLEADPVGASRPTNVEEKIAAYLDQTLIPRTLCDWFSRVSGRGGMKMKAASPG